MPGKKKDIGTTNPATARKQLKKSTPMGTPGTNSQARKARNLPAHKEADINKSPNN